MKDLILVVADKNMHFALRGALNRPEALGIRPAALRGTMRAWRST